jgi:hypothetical protein
MKTHTFNLNKFKKTAYYDDAKAIMQNQTRSMMNCYKAKLDSGMSANDALDSCLKEYQDSNSSKWSFKYAQKNK